MKNEIRYRVSPFLNIYTESSFSGLIIVEDFFNKRRFEFNNSLFLDVLNFCTRSKRISDIKNYLHKRHQLPVDEISDLLTQLIKSSLLVVTKTSLDTFAKKTKYWEDFGWSDALNFHTAIKDYPFLDYESIEAKQVEDDLMTNYITTDPVPPIYKQYRKKNKISLEKDFSVMDSVDLRDLLIEEVFDYDAQKIPLSKKQVSNVLFYTFGKMGTVEFPPQGKFLLKTSPSGGARHPIEAYPIILDSEIKSGIYHYSVMNNHLEELNSHVDIEEIKELLFELKTNPQFPIRMIIALSAVFPRSMWRYREPRSYRVILHDIGHVLETLKIVSKACGLKTYFGHGFQDTRFEKVLKIKSGSESIMKFAVLG